MQKIYFRIITIILAFCLLTGCGVGSDKVEQNKIEIESSETSDKTDSSSQSKESLKTEFELDKDSETNSSSKNENNSGTKDKTETGAEGGTGNNDTTTNGTKNDPYTETPSKDSNQKEDTETTVPNSDPYVGMTKTEFYAHYKPATSLSDALYRSQHGFLSGSMEVPGQYAQEADYRPMKDGMYIRNTDSFYADDGNTYIVVDARGNEVMRIYKGGAYITLEEVAAYMYAFGGSKDNIPANYTSSKKTKPTNSMWGEYLRVNHSYFTGDTNKYPYEPELPNISGCGGDLQYWELDIGTTGTVTPGYQARLYNNGTTITRGAARLVYARQDLNGNGLYEQNEIYVFYTHNHYNDFREYLNYYGGWGEMFGNVTGGGEYSSKTNCNPTPYVPTSYGVLSKRISKNLSLFAAGFSCLFI